MCHARVSLTHFCAAKSELGRLVFAVLKRVYLPVGPWRAAGVLGLGMTPGMLSEEGIWCAKGAAIPCGACLDFFFKKLCDVW